MREQIDWAIHSKTAKKTSLATRIAIPCTGNNHSHQRLRFAVEQNMKVLASKAELERQTRCRF